MGNLVTDLAVFLVVGAMASVVVLEYRRKVRLQASVDRTPLRRFLVRSVKASAWNDSAEASIRVEMSHEEMASTIVVELVPPPHWLERIKPGVAVLGRWLPEHDKFLPDWSASDDVFDASATGYRDRP